MSIEQGIRSEDAHRLQHTRRASEYRVAVSGVILRLIVFSLALGFAGARLPATARALGQALRTRAGISTH